VYVVYTCIQEAIIDYPSYTKETHKSTFRECCPLLAMSHWKDSVWREEERWDTKKKVQQFRKTLDSSKEKKHHFHLARSVKNVTVPQ